MLLQILLYSVVLPLLVTGCLLLMVWRPWRATLADAKPSAPRARKDRADRAQWGGAVGFAAAYLTCHLGIHGRPVGGQLEAWEWLLLLAPLAALVGVADSLWDLPSWLRLAAFGALAIAVGWLIVPSFQDSPWLWRLGIAATVFALCLSQRFHAQRLPGIVVPLVWVMIGSCGLPVLIASANAKFGFFSTSIAAASGASILVWLWRRDTAIAKGGVPVVSVLLPAIFFSGHFNDFGDVPFFAFALLTAAPFALGIGVIVSKRQPRAWAAWLVGLLLVVAACCVALSLVWPALTAEPAY